MTSVSAQVHGKRRNGELVKRNPRTVWMRLSDDKVIKRHIVKHKVKEKA